MAISLKEEEGLDQRGRKSFRDRQEKSDTIRRSKKPAWKTSERPRRRREGGIQGGKLGRGTLEKSKRLSD